MVVGIVFNNRNNFPTRESIADQVAYLLGPECPFLWGNGFKPVADGEVSIEFNTFGPILIICH